MMGFRGIMAFTAPSAVALEKYLVTFILDVCYIEDETFQVLIKSYLSGNPTQRF